MSWGEKSCIHYCNCPIPDECKMNTCNINCRKYEWDNKIEENPLFKILENEQLSKHK